MIEYVISYDQDPRLLQFASEALDVNFNPADVRTVSHVCVTDNSTFDILAVVVFSGWTTHSVELSIAGRHGMWASKRFIRAVYDYAFDYCKKERIHMLVAHDNHASIEMHHRLEHKYEGTLGDWFGEDKPALIFGLTKRAYQNGKWASKKRTTREAINEQLQSMEG